MSMRSLEFSGGKAEIAEVTRCSRDLGTPNEITLWEALLTVLQFGLLLIHVYAQDKRWPYLSLPLSRSVRPEEWVPVKTAPYMDQNTPRDNEYRNRDVVDIFSIHQVPADVYQKLPDIDVAESSEQSNKEIPEKYNLITLWKQQFIDAFVLESPESRKMNNTFLRLAKAFWELLCAPWRILFAFVPPYQIDHGWISFILSLIFISGITYIVTKLTDVISCVTWMNSFLGLVRLFVSIDCNIRMLYQIM